MKKAFTLAEILITLGIIGVVAVLLIPNALDKLERKRNVEVLKRAYSDLQTYIRVLDSEYDCDGNFNNCFPDNHELVYKLIDYLVEKQNFRPMGSGRLNNRSAITCRSIGTSINDFDNYCISSPTGEYVYIIGKLLHDNGYGFNYSKKEYYRGKVIIMTDAKRLKFCKYVCGSAGDLPVDNNIHSGRNMFSALLTNKRAFPNGSSIGKNGSSYHWTLLTEDTCSKEKNNFAACFQRVIDDGWEIKYPY